MKKHSARDDKSDIERWTKMICRKSYFSGYSAHWMFPVAESTLPQTIKASFSKVVDSTIYLFTDSCNKTNDAVNHIFGRADRRFLCFGFCLSGNYKHSNM
jgi:hypothetical protein